MLKLSRNGIGLLSSQYRSILRKCAFLNLCAAGVFAFSAVANATIYDGRTDPTFENMGTYIEEADTAYIYGSDRTLDPNNLKEEFSNATYEDAWIQNKGKLYIGRDTSGQVVETTTISNKHNVTIKNGAITAGGGVITNMNNNNLDTVLDIDTVFFIDNSATRFLSESGSVDNEGTAAGGVLVNYSENKVSIVKGTFEDNYTMHFNNAAGGAIYNGSNVIYPSSGSRTALGSISSTGSVYSNNHAGNELINYDEYVNGEASGVGAQIFDVWKNNSSNATCGALTCLATGGAIHNEGVFSSTAEYFYYNHAIGVTAKGGAIYNNQVHSALGLIGGEMNIENTSFFGNYAGKGLAADGKGTLYASTALGGAIYNNWKLNFLENVEYGIFFGNPDNDYGNYVVATTQAAGGAIYNDTDGTLDSIRANTEFIGNYAQGIGSGNALGGAIANFGTMYVEGGIYRSNRAVSESGLAQGGAIYNARGGTTTLKMTANITQFSQNQAAQGGAIYNEGTIDGSLSGNSSLQFISNTASATNRSGNSIYNALNSVITIELYDQASVIFGENQSVYNEGTFKINGQATATTPATSRVELYTTLYSGAGAYYQISNTNLLLRNADTYFGYIDDDTALNLTNNLIGLEKNTHMYLNSANDVLNNNSFLVNDGATLRYTMNDDNSHYLANLIENYGQVLYYGHSDNNNLNVAQSLYNFNTLNVAADKLLTNVVIDNLHSGANNQIIVNLSNSQEDTANSKADIIVVKDTIKNDESTPTKVVFYDMSGTKGVGQVYLGEDEKIYFAQTSADQQDYDFDNTFITTATNDNYEISVGYELDSFNNVYNWYLYRSDRLDPRTIPENVAMSDVPRAAVEQLRSSIAGMPMSRTNRGMCNCYQDKCNNAYCKYEKSGSMMRLWATPFYKKGTFDSPVETDFTLKGADFGLDYQPDSENMYGIFGSYRKGKYDISGKGKDYSTEIGSELDITSIVGGAYYRRYFGNTYLLGAIYGGKVDIDVDVKNGVSTSLDGYTVGAQAELGYDWRLSRRQTLTPSLRAAYNYIKLNDPEEFNGKEASIDAIHDIELEAALKYEYQFNNEYQLPTTGYIKPSVIQTFSQGGDVKITTVKYDDTIDTATLGRIEIGADAEIIKNLSIGAFGNYTFGTDYKAWGIGGNIRYVW